MAKPEVFGNFEKLQQAQADFAKVQTELKLANERWEEIATDIDEFNKG